MCFKTQSSDGKVRTQSSDFDGHAAGFLISCFIQNGYIKDAINLFPQMQAAKFEPRPEILTSILDAYTHLGALQWGEAIHGFFIRNLFYRSMEEMTHMETSILNMFVRCGEQ